MSMCIYVREDLNRCMNMCEGKTDYCATHNHMMRKQQKDESKAITKRNSLIAKQKIKNLEAKPKISKQSDALKAKLQKMPRLKREQILRNTVISISAKDWRNKYNCSDGTQVTQLEVNSNVADMVRRLKKIRPLNRCEGCGTPYCNGYAHIIAKSICKKDGRTELCWDENNVYPSCQQCNLAIENPKGSDWKNLLNRDKCMLYIKSKVIAEKSMIHELLMKFEISAVNQERPVI